MNRAIGVALALVFCLACLTSSAAESDQPLPVEQAFKPNIERVDASHIAVVWHIADGYYLYRRAFSFKLVSAGSATLGAVEIPAGKRHRDPYFGKVETYRHRVRVRLTIQRTLADGARLEIGYQGCADAGLCYPPQDKKVTVPAAANHDLSPGNASGPPTSNSPAVAEGRADALAQSLGQASLWSTVALFFVLGIGLAFTPCVLPMIPIVAGMLGSRTLSRGRVLSAALSYVIAMAAAYAVFGVIAGYFGANIRAALQRPWVLLPFAALFAVLAAASFGWFAFQIPARWQSKLSTPGRGGGLAGAAALGFSSALIAGPCLAPPLAGALLYISTSGDLAAGAIALFALGLGIGLPLIAIAGFGAGALPRAGPWMGEVRVFFGVLLLAVGLWLALRLAPADLGLACWGALALVYGAYLSTRSTQKPVMMTAKRVVVALLIGYAGLAGAGLAIGQGRSTAPLAGLASISAGSNVKQTVFQRVDSPTELRQALGAARRAGRPAMVDFYADWCVDCVRMKHGVFTERRIRDALGKVSAIEFDVTDYGSEQRQFMSKLGVFGPPTIVFYDAGGQRRRSARLIGGVDADTLLAHLRSIRRPSAVSAHGFAGS